MLSLLLAAASANGAAGSTEVVQQRLSDGRILLTDHPVRGATTERSWQMTNEDPVAARQRAADVRTEAKEVSERIQRTLDAERRADMQREQTRLAALAMAQQQRDDEPLYYGGMPASGYGNAIAAGRGRGRGHVGHHDNLPSTDRWGSTAKFGAVGKYGAATAPHSTLTGRASAGR
ncbi:MAG: hypothetical protein JO090_05200 [Rhizobacter sp.]|nr:hypothetical protein [Rhizobacter sp.]